MYSTPNDIVIDPETNELMFNSSGDIMTASDINGEDFATELSVSQWVKNRVMMDYLNGHPEVASLDSFVSEIKSGNLDDSNLSLLNSYIEDAIMEHKFIESVVARTKQDKSKMTLVLELKYKVYGSAKANHLSAEWKDN